ARSRTKNHGLGRLWTTRVALAVTASATNMKTRVPGSLEIAAIIARQSSPDAVFSAATVPGTSFAMAGALLDASRSATAQNAFRSGSRSHNPSAQNFRLGPIASASSPAAASTRGRPARERRELGRERRRSRRLEVRGVAVPPAAVEPVEVADDECGLVVDRR